MRDTMGLAAEGLAPNRKREIPADADVTQSQVGPVT